MRSASASRVELAWTGASPEWQVDRQAGSGQFEMIAAVSGDAYADGKIGAYATYHYRVRSQAGPVSNLALVGPPPAGVSVPARLPAKVDPEKYGAQAALCNDENGDPAVAFVWTDVNGDNDNSDNRVYSVRWDRARYSWKRARQRRCNGRCANAECRSCFTGVRSGDRRLRDVISRRRKARSPGSALA